MEIGVRASRPGDVSPADPVDLSPPRIFHPRHFLVKHAAAERGHPDPFDLIARNRGQIDVEQCVLGEFLHGHDAGEQTRQPGTMALHVLQIEAPVGNGHARNPRGQSLHGRRDGPRVKHVLAHVGAVVDPGEHEIRLLRHEGIEREQHAVGRRPVHLVGAVAAACRPQRPVQRQRMRGRALLAIGSDDGHLPQLARGRRQETEAARQDSVIVADQDIHAAPSR